SLRRSDPWLWSGAVVVSSPERRAGPREPGPAAPDSTPGTSYQDGNDSTPLAQPCQGALSHLLLGELSLRVRVIAYGRAMSSSRLESIPGTARLRDVAAAAGVSTSTASRVLAGAPGVPPGSAAAVAAAARRLGYRPNLVARGLRARTTGQVGIIIPGIGNPFFADLLEALESVLYDANLDMILSDSRGTHTDEARRLQTLLDRRVDGVIMIPAGPPSSAPPLRWARWSVPLVPIDRQVRGPPPPPRRVANTPRHPPPLPPPP